MNAVPASLLLAACAGLIFALGCLAVVRSIASRRPNLAQRVAQGRVDAPSVHSVRGIESIGWLTAVLENLGSTTSSVYRRLELLGQAKDAGPFRLQQAIAGLATMVITAGGVAPILRSRGVSAIPVVAVVAVVGALAGMAAWDRLLTWRSTKRQQRIDIQVPDASELLALAVGAGESIPNALDRVARISTVDLAREIERAVADMRSGVPSIRVLADLSARNDSAALDRLCQTLITSIERGSPLAQVLHDQARDIRESSRQSLMEEGGKREIAMLIPVIFLILPVTIFFALYPGLMALDISP